MKQKFNIEITRSQMNVLIRALQEMQENIFYENNNCVPQYERAFYFIANKWENKLRQLKAENSQ